VQMTPATPAPAPGEVEDQATLNARIDSALTSLDAFAAARGCFAESGLGRHRFSDYVAGRHVRWVGRLRHTLRPGSYRLVADPDHPDAAVRLVPASPDVKQDARQIIPGGQVEVEGVLMDDQSLHMTSLRAFE